MDFAAARRALRAHGPPSDLAMFLKFIPTKAEVLGTQLPEMHRLAARLKKEGATIEEAARFLDEAAAREVREEFLLGVLLLERLGPLPAAVARKVPKWLDAVDDWERCDQLAMRVAPELPASFAKSLPALAKAKNPSRRRFAPVAAAKRGEDALALRLAPPLLADADPNVRKGAAWALREVSEREPAAAERALARCGATRGALREAAKKLPKGAQRRLGL